MNISRFLGSTNREALRQVRLALGPDALIVSNRRVNGGVEILATDPTSVPHQAADTEPLSSPAAFVQQPQDAGLAQASAPQPDSELMGAIDAMRGAMETRIDELLWGNQLRRAPQAVSLFQTLLGFGFSTALLRAMLKRLPEQLSVRAALQWARNELIKHLPVLQSEDDLWVPGLALALVGPTGVGKTTTIAKLAARCVKRFGPDKLVLLTTDTYRIGAHEQLKIYGQMLRVPVHVVQDANELRRIVQTIRADQIVLIDNVGISQRDRYISEQAAMLAGAGRTINRLLVLNASSHGDTLDEVARTYANDAGTPLKGCIITKIDEASCLGAALDTAVRYKLPIHYVSNGQKVPENLLFLPTVELVDRALVNNQQSRALYAPSEADFAALMSLSRTPQGDSAAQRAETRRKQLLPGLLAAASATSAALSSEDVQVASEYVDERMACSEAFDAWRSGAAAKSDSATLGSLINHTLRMARNEASEKRFEHVLAVHEQIAVKSSSSANGYLRASLLLSGRAQGFATPLQQLSFADGWHSSCGASSQTPPVSGDIVLNQIQWLTEQAKDLPLVHLFEGGTAGLWRKCSSLGVSWMAQITPATRLWVDDSPTMAGAIARTLDYKPVSDLASRLELAELAGLPIGDIVLWVAAATVEQRTRQQGALALQLLSVRVVNRHDGSLVKMILGVRGLDGGPQGSVPAGVETAAVWLAARAEAKNCMRYAARAWDLLASEETGPQQKRALAAVQLALSAWDIKQAPGASVVRSVACGLIGKPSLTAQTAVPAVLKLFALKEMLA